MIQKDMDTERMIEVEGQLIRLYSVKDFTDKFFEVFPEGMKIPVGNVEMDTLAVYRFYPAERWMQGMPCPLQTKTGVADNRLNVEVRLKPDDYKGLCPNSDIYYSYELGQKTNLSSEDNEATMFLNKVENLQDGFVEISLADERMFLKNLYVEGVQMQKAMEILLQQHQKMTLQSFREALQLTCLKEEGVLMLEGGIRLYDEAANAVSKVIEDFQHMYTGEGNPLHKHPYYETDIKPKYDQALKEAADLSLRKLGIIETLPESLDVKWKNTRGDYWEAEQMTHVVNDMFRGYAAKVVDAERNEDWMRVNIYTTNPEYRKRIMDTLTCSWAKDKIEPVTEIQDMPEEIASAKQAAMEVKNNSLTPTFIGMNEGVYFSEKGTLGYVYVDYDRNVITQGEPLSEKNQAYVNRLAEEGNILRGNGCCLSLVGEKRLYLDRMDGSTLKVSNEIIDGKIQPVEEGNHCVFNVNPIRYLDITGRITDAKVVNNDNVYLLRCKIDGEQQPGVKLNTDDVIKFKNHQVTAEQLAVHIHAIELIDRSNNQEKVASMKR